MLQRQCAGGESGAGATGDDRYTKAMALLQQPLHLVERVRHRHQHGESAIHRKSITLERTHVLFAIQQRHARNGLGEAVTDGGPVKGGDRAVESFVVKDVHESAPRCKSWRQVINRGPNLRFSAAPVQLVVYWYDQ